MLRFPVEAFKAASKLAVREEDKEKPLTKFLSIDPNFESCLDPTNWSDFATNYLTYFNEIREDFTQAFSFDLQEQWFQTLKTAMQTICVSPRRKYPHLLTDLPWPNDMHFIPFSIFRLILFVFDFLCKPILPLRATGIKEHIQRSVSKFSSALTLWRLIWFFRRTDPCSTLEAGYNRPDSPFFNKDNPFSILKDSDLEYKLTVTVPHLISEFVSKGSLFPLHSSTPIDEDSLKFIRVLHWISVKASKVTNFNDRTIIDLLMLHKPTAIIIDAYQRISTGAGFDCILVRHCNLNYESILRQKREIEEAEDGAAFAIKLPKQESYEAELDSLHMRMDVWTCRKRNIIKKILDVKADLCASSIMSSSRSSALYDRLENKTRALHKVDLKIKEIHEKQKYLDIKYKKHTHNT